MSPFDQNIDYDAGHTIDPSIDQDDLIAFHLHELSPPQERALHRVLHTSPTLQSESVAIANTLRAFPKYEPALPLDAAALDRHWQALRPSLPIHVPPPIAPRSLFPRSVFHRWAFPALAGSALATTALLVALHHGRHTTPPITIATTQSPTSTTASISSAAPSIIASTSDSTLTTSTQNPWVRSQFNSAINNQISNPSSFPPSTPTQAALTTPNLPPTEPLTPTLPTQVSPATKTSTTTATTEAPTSRSTNPTSAISTSPTQLTKLRPPTIHHPHTTDLTLAIFGDLTPDRSSTSGDGGSAPTGSFTQATTPAVGALASFHQQLRPWLGYRITTAYSRPTFEYTVATPDTTGSGIIINERIYEFSGTYVVQGPHRHRISTSAEAGAGLLALLPTDPNGYGEGASNTVRPTGVMGVSAELALTRHWALHAGYRALLYKAPTYYSTIFGSDIPPAPRNITFSNEPVVGITYRFGKTGND